MNAELEYYFEQELRFLRKSLVRYAAENPEAAAKLQISHEGEGYADVERLVHGAALLNARMACKIEDGHASIIEGFLNVLYPHYLRPLPSLGIVQFEPDAANFQPKIELKKETTKLNAGTADVATFTLTKDLRILPIKIEQVRLKGPPFAVNPQKISDRKQVSALSFRVRRLGDAAPINVIEFENHLRLLIVEDRSDTFELIEFLNRHISGVVYSLPDQTQPFAELPPSALQPVGLDPQHDRILGYAARSFPGYGLLTEFFAYPHRFNFIDLELPQLDVCGESNCFDITIFLSDQSERLESNIDDKWLRANCCPILNLFSPESGTVVENFDLSTHETPIVVEPVPRQTESKFNLLEDRLEIFAVEHVEILDCSSQETFELFPLFGVPARDPTEHRENCYWTRREYIKSPSGEVLGSDVYLQTSPQLDLDVEQVRHWQYRIKVTAMNRHVPLDGDVRIRLSEAVKGVLKINCIRPLSPAIRPFQVSRELWRIVNHLAVNMVTLLTVESLRSLLSLYQVYERDRGVAASRLIRAIQSVELEPTMERVFVKGRPAFARGTEVRIRLDASDLPAGKAYLLASVLGAFLCGTQSINSFTRVTFSDGTSELGSWVGQGRGATL